MELQQINYDWLERTIDENLSDEVYRYSLEQGFKFVLIEGPGTKGYVRFNTADSNHRDSVNFFLNDELPRASLNKEDYRHKGGGSVKIKDFNGDDAVKETYTLVFSGASDELGKFDRELLARTLSEGLSPQFRRRFTYEIL